MFFSPAQCFPPVALYSMKNLLLISCSLLLICCQEQTKTNDRDQRDSTSVSKSDSSANTVPQSKLIVPGKQMGNIMLGLPADSLSSMLGKPDFSDAAMGKAWLIWYGKKRDEHNNRSSLEIFITYADSTMRGKTVQQILTTSPEFETARGAKVYDDLASIQQKYPGIVSTGHYKELNGGRVFQLYDDLQNGIAFEIAEANKQYICIGIIIHYPGRPITAIPENS